MLQKVSDAISTASVAAGDSGDHAVDQANASESQVTVRRFFFIARHFSGTFPCTTSKILKLFPQLFDYTCDSDILNKGGLCTFYTIHFRVRERERNKGNRQ